MTLPKLEALPSSLQDGAITLRLDEGVPMFSASVIVVKRVNTLLEREREGQLNGSESEELTRYEEIDDYLSHLNRVVRNMLLDGSKNL
jgi:hypothetical protein